MRRSQFIRTLSVGGSMLLLPVFSLSCSGDDFAPQLAIPKSLLPICESPRLMEIGQAYRALKPQEADPGVLAGLITAGLSPESPSFLANLQDKISEEFQRGELIEVQGWMLAITEARQCALYSLFKP